MEFKKRLISRCKNLDFKSYSSIKNSIFYSFGEPGNLDLAYCNFEVLLNSSNSLSLIIYSIRKGQKNKINNMLNRTLEVILSNYDITKVTFDEVIESRTIYTLLNSKENSGKINDIPNFSYSPFLRELNNFDFNLYETNINCEIDDFEGFYLSGLK